MNTMRLPVDAAMISDIDEVRNKGDAGPLKCGGFA